MHWMLFYAALAIPAFYAVGLLASPRTSFVVNDFWRFWVVHLWVEDFLELFTTVMVAYMFVLLGVVREATALRVIYLDIILYSLGETWPGHALRQCGNKRILFWAKNWHR
jgi:nitric oxide reductase subunit B